MRLIDFSIFALMMIFVMGLAGVDPVFATASAGLAIVVVRAISKIGDKKIVRTSEEEGQDLQ